MGLSERLGGCLEVLWIALVGAYIFISFVLRVVDADAFNDSSLIIGESFPSLKTLLSLY